MSVYITAEEARCRYAAAHPYLPVGAIPRFPEGCRENAEYVAELKSALTEWVQS